MGAVILFVGTEKGAWICRSDAKRATWKVEGPLFKGWKVTCSARTADGRWLAGTASRVYGAALHASDDLKAWRQIEKGPAYPEGGDRKLNQVWTLHAGAARVWAGVDTAGLFTSDDGGESWQPVPALNDHPTRKAWFPGAGGLCAHVVLTDPRNPDRVWCGISAVGVWHSEDGGASWRPQNRGIKQIIEDAQFKEIGFCVHGLVADPDDSRILYRQDHAGMYKSGDGGETWTPKMNGLASWFGFPIAMDPRTKALYAFPLESDEYRMPVEGKFRVYRSRDGAESWQALGEGLPAAPTWAGVLRGAMAVDGQDPGGVYVGATNGSLFASADGGDTWRPLPCSLPRILSVRAYGA